MNQQEQGKSAAKPSYQDKVGSQASLKDNGIKANNNPGLRGKEENRTDKDAGFQPDKSGGACKTGCE